MRTYGKEGLEMMTNEEAIMILNMVEAYGLADEAKKIVVSALEKQIPKKPDVISNMGTTYWNCHICSSLVADSVIGVRYMHYCGICGQRLY